MAKRMTLLIEVPDDWTMETAQDVLGSMFESRELGLLEIHDDDLISHEEEDV